MKRWNEDEVNWLIENYPKIGKVSCANFLNKSIDSIRAKASNLGLKQDKSSDFFNEWQSRAATSKKGKKRPEQAKVMNQLREQGKLKMTKEGKKKISISVKNNFQKNGHPRGMKGKKHSLASLEKISNSSINMWKNPECSLNQHEHRQKLSDRMSLLQTEGKLRNAYSR